MTDPEMLREAATQMRTLADAAVALAKTWLGVE